MGLSLWKGGMLTESQGPAMVGLQFGEVFLFGERRQDRHIENVFRPQFHQSCNLGIVILLCYGRIEIVRLQSM